MPFSDLAQRIFSFDSKSMSERIIRDTWLEQKNKADHAHRIIAQRYVDWYNRNTEAIKLALIEQANKTFKSGETSNWHWPIINSVARIIKRVSMTYIVEPKRALKRDGKELPPTDPVYGKVFGDEGMFRNIDMTKKFKQFERWSKLLNTIHVEVVPRNGAIDWDLRLRPGTMVVEDPLNYLDFVRIAYRWELMDPDTLKGYKGWVIWDEEEHVFQLDDGYRVGMSEESGANPYGGEIPVVTIRMMEQDDYWGKFGGDLVDAVQAFHVQLANMWENALLQTHGQPIAINLGFDSASQILTGPRHPITVNNVTTDDVMPALIFAKPDTDLEKVTQLLQWYLEAVANSYGLPRGSWSMDEVPESGFAKFMNNIELIENRDDDVLQWKRIEKDLFDKSRLVYNKYKEDGDEVPEDIELEVEFQPVAFPESPTEEATRYTILIGKDLSSPIRYFMETRGMTEEDATKMATKIAEENKKFSQMRMPAELQAFQQRGQAGDDDVDEDEDEQQGKKPPQFQKQNPPPAAANEE
jgi:hypothetical protein